MQQTAVCLRQNTVKPHYKTTLKMTALFIKSTYSYSDIFIQ